jgi:mono/diheme cytochrome c family protein
MRPLARSLPAPALALALAAAGLAAQDPGPALEPAVRSVLGRYCSECHGGDRPEADLDLLRALAGPVGPDLLDLVLDLRDALETRQMPPAKADQPTAAEREAVLAWARQLLARAAAAQPPDPGRVTVRRLSRFEYANTVRDLCGIEVEIADFPADDLAYGFDNVGEALSVSTLHLEKYAAAAEQVAAAAWPDPDPPSPPTLHLGLDDLEVSREDARRADVLFLITNGEVRGRALLPRPGRYRIEVEAWATQAGEGLARMDLRADGRRIASFEVAGTRAEPGRYRAELEVEARALDLTAAFVNDLWDPDHPDPDRRDRNLAVRSIAVEGPLDPRAATVLESRLRPLDPGRGRPAARARRLLAAFLEQAWRRPVARHELGRFTELVEDAVEAGETFDGGLRWAIQAALVAPHFLFRIEAGAASGATTPEALDGHALATRLAYFLWSSMPDAALRAAARDGSLASPAGLAAAANRLLADPRAVALARNFAGQWLELRRLPEVRPDPDRHPDWDPELSAAAARETELLFEVVLRDGLPARTLVDATFTHLDPRLARHYGIAFDGEPGRFARVELEGRRPGGVLGHASFLALTSNPTRTSPVRRGKWILDHLLDDPPPAPPPGFDSFADGDPVDSAATLREQMAAHRSRPDCAACHRRMDALGLALEGFDPVGRPRSRDAGGPIDTSAELPDGRLLRGADDLQRLVADDPAFRRALLGKLFVYAVGRGIRPADALLLDARARALPADASLADFVLAIVELDAFRSRSPG